MLKKEQRLTKDKEFDQIFKQGYSSYDKILGIKATKNDLEHSRFGILISTKVSKKSVERNLIKRRIREILQQVAPSFKVPVNLAVIVLPTAKDKSFQELENSIKFNLKKLRLT